MTTEPPDHSARDVWLELRSQRDILIEMKTLLTTLTAAKDDHETRLRKLEERKLYLPAVSVLIAALSLIATVVLYVIKT